MKNTSYYSKLTFKLSALVVLIIFHFPNQAFSQWEWKNPLPQGNSLRTTWFVNDSTGYMAGDVGTIMKTTNGGDSWDIKNLTKYGKLPVFKSICFPDESHGFAATNGHIYKTSDAGLSWDSVFYEEDEAISDLYFTDSVHGYAVCTNGKILFTYDGGNLWQSQIIASREDLSSVWFPTYETGYITGWSGSIYKSINHGLTWSKVFSDTLAAFKELRFTSPLVGCAIADPGKLVKTINGGLTWTETQFPDSLYILTFGMFDDNNLIIISEYTAVWPGYMEVKKSNDGGTSWTHIFLPQDYSANDLACTPEGHAYMAGYMGFIAKSDDYGLTWNKISSSFNGLDHFGSYIRDIDFPDTETGYAIGAGFEGQDGLIIKTTDGGNTWEEIYSSDQMINLNTVKFTGINNGFCGGTNLLSTTDGGYNWQLKYTGTERFSITSIDFASPSTGIACGVGGTFLRTTDDGQTWSQVPGMPLTDYYCVWFVDESLGFASAGDTLFKTTDAGINWVPISINYQLKDICFTSPHLGYGLAFPGGIVKTNNGGYSWTPLPQPTDDPLLTLSFFDQDTGFVAGGVHIISSVIFKTTDGGLTWEEQFIPTIAPIEDILVRGDYTVFAADFFAGLFYNPTPGIITTALSLPLNKTTCNLMAYPNPSSEKVSIEYSIGEEGQTTIELYTLTGRYLQTITEGKRQPGTYSHAISTVGLKAGVYLLRITQGGSSETRKIVIL